MADPEIRADALVTFLTSVMQNAANNAGSSSDPSSAWMVQPTPLLSSQAHGWLWAKNGIAAAIAQIPPQELAQCGLHIATAETDPDCSRLDERHGLSTSMGETMTWARTFGGAATLIDVEGDDWSQPWVPSPGQTVRLRVAHAPLLRPVYTGPRGWRAEVGLPQIWRSFAPPWGLRYYELSAGTWSSGIDGAIHWTRVLPMIGHPIPDGIGIPSISGWPGLSIFDHIWSQLIGDEALAGAARRVSDRMAVWVLTIATLAAKQAGPEAAGLQGVIDAISERFRTSGLMPVPADGKLEAVGLPMDGFDKLSEVNKSHLTAVARIPEFKVWGTSATGFGDDDGARENWRNTLRSWWDRDWRSNVRRAVLGLSIVEHGTAPAALTLDPGGWLTRVSIEAERTIGQVENVVGALVSGGVITRDEGRARLEAEGWDLVETEPAAPTPAIDADATIIDSPDDIPDDTSAEDFAAQMTANGFTACEHGKKNRCTICRIERVRQVEKGPDGQPVYGGGWRAIRADADWTGTSYLWLPVPETERVATVQRAVNEIVPLEGYAPGDPMPAVYHVTALYLGETSKPRAREIQTRAPVAVDGPIRLRPRAVSTFPAQKDGRSPIFIELDGVEIAALNARLRTALAPLPPPEHATFIAHVTLGFARLTPEQTAALTSIPVPADLGESAELRFTFDGRDTVWPL